MTAADMTTADIGDVNFDKRERATFLFVSVVHFAPYSTVLSGLMLI